MAGAPSYVFGSSRAGRGRRRLAVRRPGYRPAMPHWILLAVATAVGWLVVAVVGGLLLGRALGAIDRSPDEEQELRLGGRTPTSGR